MTKSFLIACTAACFALDASAQVGLGGAAVGSLGANGSASAVGSLGSGIRTGTTSRGADLRGTGQIDSSQTPAAASLGIDARTTGSGVSAETAGSASGSVLKFLRMFDGTYQDPVLDHTGFLTAAELRLIAEWLDIGAQYYNDPFVAPAAN